MDRDSISPNMENESSRLADEAKIKLHTAPTASPEQLSEPEYVFVTNKINFAVEHIKIKFILTTGITCVVCNFPLSNIIKNGWN